MSKQYDFTPHANTIPDFYLDNLGEYISTLTSNLYVEIADPNTVRIPASAGNGQVCVGIAGKWRFIQSPVSCDHPGGLADNYDLYAKASDNNFGGVAPSVDLTTYSFTIEIRASGSPPASGIYRKIATVRWDGSRILDVRLEPGIGGASKHYVQELMPGPGIKDGERWTWTGAMWDFLYYDNAWRFVGGAPNHAEINDPEALTAASTWSNLATVGPDVVIPFGGEYLYEYGARWDTDAVGTTMYVGPQVGVALGDGSPFHVGAAGSVLSDAAHGFSGTIMSAGTTQISRGGSPGAVGGGSLFRMRYYRLNDGGSLPLRFAYRWLRVLPLALPGLP